MIRRVFSIMVLLLPCFAYGANPTTDLNINVVPVGSPIINAATYGPITTPASVNVTFANGPGDGTDYIELQMYYSATPYTDTPIPLGTTSGTISIPLPYVKSDRPGYYMLIWFHGPDYVRLATDPGPIVINPTITPAAPTQGLPASAGGAPFTPQHVMNVCLSGCTYSLPSQAIALATANNWDYVKITIEGGDYGAGCGPGGCDLIPGSATTPNPILQVGGQMPAHLWLYGWSPDGVTFPHFWGQCSSSCPLITTGNVVAYEQQGQAAMTVDNIEFGPYTAWTIVPKDATAMTFRNIYVHDCAQGIVSADAPPMNAAFYNVHVARCGGNGGLDHDVYIGESGGQGTTTVLNSVFEQSKQGHAFKERSHIFNASCSIFSVNSDLMYLGSETMDVAEGGQWTIDHVLTSSGGASPSWSTGSAVDNVRYAHEPVVYPPYINTPTSTNSVWLHDVDATTYGFITWGAPMTNPPITTWANNIFEMPDTSQLVLGGIGYAFNAADGYPTQTGVQTDISFNPATNPIYQGRAAAGLPANGAYPQSYYDLLPVYNQVFGSFCTDPIGNVLLPTTSG
jgi:hypothetical protein